MASEIVGGRHGLSAGRLQFRNQNRLVCAGNDQALLGQGKRRARNGICVVEWSERIEEALPEDAVRVRIERRSDTERTIRVEGML